jgi:hypothetical protein
VTDPTEVQRLRETFFRRTRRTAALLYAGLGLSAVGFGIAAIVSDPLRGWDSRRVAALAGAIDREPAPQDVSPDGSRAGVLGFDSPAVSGALAGFFAGSIVGIALIRRRLVTDDALLLRQRSLGFDPEHPYGWLRGKQ